MQNHGQANNQKLELRHFHVVHENKTHKKQHTQVPQCHFESNEVRFREK